MQKWFTVFCAWAFELLLVSTVKERRAEKSDFEDKISRTLET
jgi:hypothetical protein